MDKIDQAFQEISRADFLPGDAKQSASFDQPVVIGFGQTNSQPTTVRMMLEWLDPRPDDKILDVGSGSGWTTALLGYLVGLEGHVYAVEKIPELVEFGASNCKKAGIKNVNFYEAHDSFGLQQLMPYDRILVSAAADELPDELKDQLKVHGRLVIPIKNSIFVIDKLNKDKYEQTEYPGFAFVPLL